MITNERQYKITKSQLKKIEDAINSFKVEKTDNKGSEILAKAELDALLSEQKNLITQLSEYEKLKSGKVDVFRASSLKGLPDILIKARIAKNLSQKELAELIGIKEQQIQRYEAEHYTTANLIRLVQVAKALKLNISEIAEFNDVFDPVYIKDENIDWDQFPIKEMYLRNWFEDFFNGTLSEAINNSEELIKKFSANAYDKPLFYAARQRVRIGGKINKYALIAWQWRIINLAKKEKISKKFYKYILTKEWFNNLVKLSIKKDGPEEAVQYLYKFGIRLIIQPHLPQTYLDGAVFLLKDGPVIGMTLRYDRLDNFWFVLFHELVHLKNHIHKGKIESIFDNLETDANDFEKETDRETGELLIPSKVWETALPRYIQKEDIILDFAKKIGVNPAIVAGKIRREMENYYIFINLVGKGEVRKRFLNVDFSY